MGKINDLSEGNIAALWEEIRKLKFATNQNNMGLGRGSGLSVYDGGTITIENGGLHVIGSATFSGTLYAEGDIDMSGTFNMSGTFTATGEVQLNGPTTIEGDVTSTGEFTQTGSTHLNGETTIAGDTTVTGRFDVDGPMKTTSTLDVEGVTNLKNDLNVTGGGKIKFGDMTIDPSLFGGSVSFNGGGYLSGTAAGPQITGPANNSFVYTRSALAGLQATDIELVGAVEVRGSVKVTSPGTVSGVEPNVYIDGAGNIRRITPQ